MCRSRMNHRFSIRAPEVWKAAPPERRQKWASVDLFRYSPTEEKIRLALPKPTTVEFLDLPLEDCITFLKEYHNINIFLDRPTLTDEGVALDQPITLKLAGVKRCSILKLLLEPVQLTYVIEDEVMKITTSAKAGEKLSTRVYPVGDLVIPITTPRASAVWRGGMGGGGCGRRHRRFRDWAGGGGGFGFRRRNRRWHRRGLRRRWRIIQCSRPCVSPESDRRRGCGARG